MGRERNPLHISKAIKQALGGIEQRAAAGATKEAIMDAWRRAAGEKAARHSSPAGVKNEVLVINVDSTTWIYQLKLKEPELLKRMARLLRAPQIKQIRFRAGEIEKNGQTPQ